MKWPEKMQNTNWLKQVPGKPSFPDLLWSRPENKRQAGKLLIVGGNSHGFTAPATAHSAALAAGVGTASVILPAALEKTLGTSFPEAEFAPSTPSGSFARLALDALLDSAQNADGVLLAGDFGKNSETAILLESFLKKDDGLVNLSGDSVDYFSSMPETLFERYNIIITTNVGNLQKLAKGRVVIRQTADLAQLVTQLSELSQKVKPAILAHHLDQGIVAFEGRVSTTPIKSTSEVDLAATASVWALQNTDRIFGALTSSVFEA